MGIHDDAGRRAGGGRVSTERPAPVTSPTVGARATVSFGGRRTSDLPLVVTEVSANGRTLVAQVLHVDGFGQVRETYTLRRNGKYARKGAGQWDEFLRFAADVPQ